MKGCLPGHGGLRCELECSENCEVEGEVCDVDGICLHGCKTAGPDDVWFTGEKCSIKISE